jgi:excisionase family DNA binding protein
MDRTIEDAQTLLTVEDVARLLGVTRSWVYAHQDELPFTRLGSGPRAILRMDRADLRRYLLRDKRDAVSVPQVESLDRQVNA